MELNSKVINSLEILKKSALFSMSLGAKELFHSNFIAYLLSSKNKNLNSAKNALKQVFFEKIFDDEIICLREKNNLDLILIRSNFKDLDRNEISCVVVEIKLKSTPTKEQLDNYDEKIKKGINLTKLLSNECDTNDQIIKIKNNDLIWSPKRLKGNSTKIRKVLLAPTKPLSTSEGENLSWDYISWLEVINGLKKNIVNNNDLESMILENYVVSLENILVILNEINIMATKFLDNTDNLFYSHIIDFINFDNKFDNIRIHDLVSKYFVRIISDRITQDLSNQLVLDNNCIVQITDNYSHKRPIINILYEFTYKDIDCLKYEGDSIKLGVQIEENDYRHIFEIKSKDINLRKSFIDTVSNQDLFPWLHKFEKKKVKNNDDAVLYTYTTDYYDFRYSKSINICNNNYSELLRSIKESLQTGYYDFKKVNF